MPRNTWEMRCVTIEITAVIESELIVAKPAIAWKCCLQLNNLTNIFFYIVVLVVQVEAKYEDYTYVITDAIKA